MIIPRDRPKQGISAVSTGIHPYAEDTRPHTCTYACPRMQTATGEAAQALPVTSGHLMAWSGSSAARPWWPGLPRW